MSNTDAFDILQDLASWEFPQMFQLSLEFAIFRTFGIPSISRLLKKTNQICGSDAPKRIVDTMVLIAELTTNSPESVRHNEAISRMNYIHGIYQKARLIRNEDMLYTLALFTLEPLRWIERYEWRNPTELERCASGTFWKATGDAMEISYAGLPSGLSGFDNALQWLCEMETWSRDYEKSFMVPDKSNYTVAEGTVACYLDDLPELLRPLGRKILCALLDDRLRRAILYPTPPVWCPVFVNFVFHIRKFWLRHFMPPRLTERRGIAKEPDPTTGRYFLVDELNQLWRARHGASGWLRIGKPSRPAREHLHFPNGYQIHEIGPKCTAGHGMVEHKRTKEKLLGQNRGRCPFRGKFKNERLDRLKSQ